VPKRKKRELQHLRQEPARRRDYQLGGTAPRDIYKPGFPMNLFGNVKLFAALGVVVIFTFIIGAIFTSQTTSNVVNPDILPTNTPTVSTTPDGSTTPGPTTVSRQFEKAEQVIDPATRKYTATFKTSEGEFVVALNADAAPNTVNSFVFLAQQKYFDGLTFHRVSPGFVIQSGDPTALGNGGPGYSTADEPNEIKNTRGTLSMAKVSGQAQFGSQFFVNLKDNPSLDFDNPTANKFYPFGEVTSGLDVVDKIGAVPTDSRERPTRTITIESVTITDTAK